MAFLGQDGFVWAIGVVEDRFDPEKQGRVRVRWLGYHTDEKAKILTIENNIKVLGNLSAINSKTSSVSNSFCKKSNSMNLCILGYFITIPISSVNAILVE